MLNVSSCTLKEYNSAFFFMEEKEFKHLTDNEIENLVDFSIFLFRSATKSVEEGKICKSKFPVLFAENCLKQSGQKKTNPISPVKIVEFKSLSGTTKE